MLLRASAPSRAGVAVRIAVTVGLAAAAVAAAPSGAAVNARNYTRTATQACLTALPNAVAGLPPTTPPVPPMLFVQALAGHDISTSGGVGPRPRAHRQLGIWYGDKGYQGIILSFFSSVDDARMSLKALAGLYGQAHPERRRRLGSKTSAEPKCAPDRTSLSALRTW
jgi:hypothetical protein